MVEALYAAGAGSGDGMTDTLPFDTTGGPAPGPPPHLRLPEAVGWAAFSDFGPYLAHAAAPGQRLRGAGGVPTEAVEHGLLFGWVTAARCPCGRRWRAARRVLLPHFVAVRGTS
ncbi:putative NTD biosynthesis operon hydrolase NtdB [Streptomyces afghaniensis 772] [Streptomyces afghaniensis]